MTRRLRTERVGGIMLALDYWDCECEDDYIHPNSVKACGVCGSEQEDQPSSRADEVRAWRRERERGLLAEEREMVRREGANG